MIVTANDGTVVSTVTAGADGAFNTGQLTSLSTATSSLSVVQQVGSLRSPAITVATSFAPGFASPADGATCKRKSHVSIVLSGWPGQAVLLQISSGARYSGTLGSAGTVSFTETCGTVGSYTLTASYAAGGGSSSITGSVVR